MNVTAIRVVPGTKTSNGLVTLQPAGPTDSTHFWAVYLRLSSGLESWVGDRTRERDAQALAQQLAQRYTVEVEVYPWAPTKLMTACAIALRTTYGIDLYDVGVESEGDLHSFGFADPDAALEFAHAMGRKYDLDRIDI